MKTINAIAMFFLAAICVMGPGTSFADDLTGSQYNLGEHRRIQYVKLGVVEGVRAVTITTPATNNARMTGAAIGAALAGLAGNSQNNFARVALATLGGAGGAYVGGMVGRETANALEIVVKLDDGRSIVVVQGTDPQYPIFVGDRVRLIEGREVRVATIR